MCLNSMSAIVKIITLLSLSVMQSHRASSNPLPLFKYVIFMEGRRKILKIKTF